jgi:hypothetical protein
VEVQYSQIKEHKMNDTESTCKVLNTIFFLLLAVGAYLLVQWAFTFVGL